jgi:hypothetical protein
MVQVLEFPFRFEYLSQGLGSNEAFVPHLDMVGK